jgi:hypothetical protein
VRRTIVLAVVFLALLGAGIPLLHRPARVVASGPRGGASKLAPEAVAWVTVPTRPAEVHPAPREIPNAPPPPAPGKRTALIVGINHAAGHNPLQGAVRDADNLRQALASYGFPSGNVTVLEEGAATSARILAELDRLALRSPADGRAVFMFAGHTRRVGSSNYFVAADGGYISAGAVASRLARVQAPMWVVLPTCYAGGYQLNGIVGPRRIATFASSADNVSYEIGSAGSWLVLYMVEYAMIDREAPASVEAAFAYAKAAIDNVNPDRAPYMVDGFPGDMVLGVPGSGAPAPEFAPSSGDGVSGPGPDGTAESAPQANPPDQHERVSVCGDRFSVSCS